MNRFSDFISLRYSAGGHPATRVISQPAGAVLAWSGLRLGLSPNIVTGIALLTSLLASAAYALLDPGSQAMLTCIVLTQLGYALDCADGQLARATQRTSRLGAWLDVYCDYLAVLALSFAVIARLEYAGELPQPGILVVVLFFTFGRVSSLYSSTMARLWRSAEQKSEAARKSAARTLLTLAIDTPVTLLTICLLRDRPRWLIAYMLLGGSVFVLHGAYVGRGAARAPAA